jgi:hypothetical protein
MPDIRRWSNTRIRNGRLLAVLLVAVAGLAVGAAQAFATSATAGPAARLTVVPGDATPGHASDATADVVLSPRSPAAARLVIYAPQGWGISTGGAAGSPVGAIFVEALTDTSPFGPAVGFSTLSVGAPALATDAVAQACSPGPHNAVWVTTVKVTGGTQVSLRFYLDQTSGSETALGAYRITTCLPSPYLPEQQGGAPGGLQVSDLSFSMPATNPASQGTYAWRVLVTPYGYGTATPDTASTFEARTHVLFPYALTLRASYQTRTRTLVVSGRVLALGKPAAGVRVSLFADWAGTPADTFALTEFRDLTTRSDGSFRLSEPRRKIVEPGQAAKLDISAFVDAVPGACAAPTTAPGGCVDDSLSPPVTPSDDAVVKIPSNA